MSRSFVVIENTPGYMPDSDEPATFDNYEDAVEYLNELAAEYADDADSNYRVEYGVASADNLAAVIVHDDDKMHDLGRVIQIVIDDEPDDDEPDDDEPDDDDAFITDTTRGYDIAYAGKYLGSCVEWDDAVAMVRAAMDAGKFWPNVWHINDHGNTDLVTLEPAHCGAWKPETHEDRGSIDCGCGWGAYCELSSEYVGSEGERFGLEQARGLLEGTAGYKARPEQR